MICACPSCKKLIKIPTVYAARSYWIRRGARGAIAHPPEIFQDHVIIVLLAPARLKNQAFFKEFSRSCPPPPSETKILVSDS